MKDEEIIKKLVKDFGIIPSDKNLKIWREAIRLAREGYITTEVDKKNVLAVCDQWEKDTNILEEKIRQLESYKKKSDIEVGMLKGRLGGVNLIVEQQEVELESLRSENEKLKGEKDIAIEAAIHFAGKNRYQKRVPINDFNFDKIFIHKDGVRDIVDQAKNALIAEIEKGEIIDFDIHEKCTEEKSFHKDCPQCRWEALKKEHGV